MDFNERKANLEALGKLTAKECGPIKGDWGYQHAITLRRTWR